jgi:hypothetical protein
LTPSKWFDSNQRGLKLPEVYSKPPILDGNLEQISKQFYKRVEKSLKEDAKTIAEALKAKEQAESAQAAKQTEEAAQAEPAKESSESQSENYPPKQTSA